MTQDRTGEHLHPARSGWRPRVTRRQFGRGIGLVLTAGGLWLVGGNAFVGQTPPPDSSLSEVPLETLDSAAFGARVGDRFQVQPRSGDPVELELIRLADQVSDPTGTTKPGAPRVESFTLVFRGPKDRPLRQDTYQFSQAKIGVFPLFIVPGAADGNSLQYVATFNRLF
jgi:hypothetical protein